MRARRIWLRLSATVRDELGRKLAWTRWAISPRRKSRLAGWIWSSVMSWPAKTRLAAISSRMSWEGSTPVRDAETSLSANSGKRAGSGAPTSQGIVALTLAEFPGRVAEELLWKVRLLAHSFWPLAYIFVPVLQRLLDHGHELVSHSAINNAVVIAQSQVNERTDRDGVVALGVGDHHGRLGDAAYAEDGDVGLVDNRQTEDGAKGAGIGHGKG